MHALALETESTGTVRFSRFVAVRTDTDSSYAMLGRDTQVDGVRFEWDALDCFEEDEPLILHPRNPYVRVDSLRSYRHIRVELDGVVLAETQSAILLFETGLPTRFYIDRTDVDFSHL